MATSSQINTAETLVCYLLRGLCRRIDYTRIGSNRRRGLAREMADYLVPASISARSTEEWVRLVCNRFEIEPTGEGWVGDGGREHDARPAHAVLPLICLPEGTIREETSVYGPRLAIARVRWDHLARQIDFGALRLAIDRNPALIVTFAMNPPVDGEETIFSTERHQPKGPPWSATLPVRLHTPRAYWTVATLTSPCTHGADGKSGNVTMFRRQRYIDPVSGETYLAPFISGNAWRGIWRDEGGALTCRDVGLKLAEVQPKIAHALMAGGTIEAGADSSHVDLALRRKVRTLLPAWDLFAGVMNQQIMRGVLRVHDSHLVCRENAWLLFDRLKPTREGKTLTYEEFREALEPADNLTQLRLLTRHAHRELDDSDGMQMLTETEVLLPGAQLVHSFQLIANDGVSSLAKSFLSRLLREFRDNAFVGAGNARGLGAIAFDAYRPEDGAIDLPPEDEYLGFVEHRREEIRAFLLGIKDETVVETKPAKGKRGRAA